MNEEKQAFKAECHCGNVKLKAVALPETVTSCNCSICHRLGALWAYYISEEVNIHVGNSVISSYSWGEKTIDFHHCTQCGCTTHYTSISATGEKRIAVNGRMAPLETIQDIEVRHFDGAVTWKYIE